MAAHRLHDAYSLPAGSGDQSRCHVVMVVFYRLSPHESPAMQSLVQTVGRCRELRSPALSTTIRRAAHELPITPFPGTYRHDPSNPGLAMAYQYALQQAGCDSISWLLLLDQDTTVTAEYLAEAVHMAPQLRQFGAIVPKLVQDGGGLSTHWAHCVYNFGALLRVVAVCAARVFHCSTARLTRLRRERSRQSFAGRFGLMEPHVCAMFARLQAQQCRVFLLHAALSHQLESKSQDMHTALKTSARLRGTLTADPFLPAIWVSSGPSSVAAPCDTGFWHVAGYEILIPGCADPLHRMMAVSALGVWLLKKQIPDHGLNARR